MQVEFLKQFSKDLDGVSLKTVKRSVVAIIELLENARNLREIPNIKKLKGHKSAYRIRIGDYRLGFFADKSSVTLARIVHRRDIYTVFP